MDTHTSKLALFQKPYIESSIIEEDYIDFRPTGTISKGSVIEFTIPGTATQYILLKKSTLHVKFKVTKANGSPVVADDPVAPVNITLHSLFRQVDVLLNQKVVSPDVGVNYPYKAITDCLVLYGQDEKESQLQAEMFYKDSAKAMDATDPNIGGNSGLFARHGLTGNGQICSVEGSIRNDIWNQDKAILNGVQICVRLFPTLDSFRLMADNEEQYQVVITEAYLRVCHVKVNPKVVVAHDEALSIGEALYPFWKSNIKTYGIATGSFTFSIEDFLNGETPNSLIVGLTAGDAYAGSYKKNPYRFTNFTLNYLELLINGNPVPARPFQPDYKNGDYTTEYLSLYYNHYPPHGGNFISRSDYPDGYNFYIFNCTGQAGKKLMTLPGKGNTRLNFRFTDSLPHPVTVIVYSHTPALMKIDKTRNVILA